jgi:large subunit ribosomal protein L14
MIYTLTNLNVADNSGALKVRCIKILNNKKIGKVGDLLLVSVLKINPLKKILRSSLQKGVLVRSCLNTRRSEGIINLYDKAIVVLNNNLLPIGTRIFGPVLRELRLKRNKYTKILSLAKYVL